MPDTPPNYRLVLYEAPTICKDDRILEAILRFVTLDKPTLVKSMRQARFFTIENLGESEARECASTLRELGVEVDVEVAMIDPAQKSWLLAESQKWVKRGFIFPGTANKILSQYGIEERIAAPARPEKAKDPKTLIKTVLYIGGTLIGLGIILFIAANWDKISDSVKIVGATVISLGLLHGGFLVQSKQLRKAYLAPGLFLASALSIGGTILLIGQIYHVQAESYLLPLVWGVVILPIPLMMGVPSVMYLSGGLWLLSQFYYQGSHAAFFWLYPILLLGILLPYSLRTENRNLYLFCLGSIMLSCFAATTVTDHWANLLYAASLMGLYFLKQEDLLQTLALLCLAMWNISFLNTYESFPNVFYLIPLGYFYWQSYKKKSAPGMLLNALNTLFWLFTFFYQLEQRFDWTGPEGTDVVFFLLAMSLLGYSVGKALQPIQTWHALSDPLLKFAVLLGLGTIYVLSYRFYREESKMVNSPAYLVGIIVFAVTAVILFATRLKQAASSRRENWVEWLIFALVILGLMTALTVQADHVWHVLFYNSVLFLTAFLFMIDGFQRKILGMYNGGVVLFVVLILSRYFDTLWRFIPRSLFFIIGGVLLVIWAFYFEQKRRLIVQSLKDSKL